MRVREIIFRDFRNFRGERRISFVDPLTDQVRPITVIAGTTGTGKTTIRDAIEAIVRHAAGRANLNEGVLSQLLDRGNVSVLLEVSPVELI